MTSVASRDLRNHTADVLRRVADGDRLTITVNGSPVAEIGPVSAARRRPFLSKAEARMLLTEHLADPGLRGDLDRLGGDTTDDLGPIQ